MNGTLAPIIIFAFNRAGFLEDLISSLKQCEESSQSDLYIFVDGPRSSKESAAVQKVRDIASHTSGFRSVVCEFSDVNKGLGPSIISGVTKVLEKHGRAIVLEDDLKLTPNFLSFMNQSLDFYSNNEKVFSVCGCSLSVVKPSNYIYDTYFETRHNSTGWGTWLDRWQTIDWELKEWSGCKKNKRAFCKSSGSDCYLMLRNWKIGKNKSWAIRFCYAQFVQGRLSVFPFTSKVDNQGFDGSGTNSKRYNRFKYDIDITPTTSFVFSPNVKIENKIHKQILHYHSIPLRIWSRLMYLFYS